MGFERSLINGRENLWRIRDTKAGIFVAVFLLWKDQESVGKMLKTINRETNFKFDINKLLGA